MSTSGWISQLKQALTADEQGQIGGLEGLVLGILVFVVGTLVIVDSWGVIDAKLTVDSAAQNAVRAFVQAPSPAAAVGRAQAAAASVIASSGRNVLKMRISISGSLTRCSQVSVDVRYPVSFGALPLVGKAAGTVLVSSTQSELVDPFRSAASGVVPPSGACG